MSANKNMIDLSNSVYKINRIVKDYTQRLIEAAGIKDLQPSAFVILLPLLDIEGQTLSDLAKRIHMKAPTITVIANRLEERGLIRRERGLSDRRQVHLYLTAEGRKKAETLSDIQAKVAQQMALGVSKNNLTETKELLERIALNVSKKIS